jgi:SAM-dependent MidA family methyltransferase
MVRRLAGRLDGRRSLLLLFDYGYERDRLYAPWRREGTLMTMRRHVPGDNPYLHPGEQDITCHIDLSQYAAAARGAGLRPYPVVSQAEWLRTLGAAILPPVAEAGVPMNEYLAARRAVDALTDPAGLGRIMVLAAAYGEPGSLPGLAEGSDA